MDHTFYNTDSVLKTMELLLGLPPMSQYDAIANPILDFDNADNSAAYTRSCQRRHHRRTAACRCKNSPRSRLAKLSHRWTSRIPTAPTRMLNEILWKSVKGINSKMPEPRHALTSQTAQGKSDKATRHD